MSQVAGKYAGLKRHVLLDLTDSARQRIVNELAAAIGADGHNCNFAQILLPQQAGARIPGIVRRDETNRAGGRILSVGFGNDGVRDAFADLGPSWIWPGQGHIASLLQDLQITVFEQYSSGTLVYEDEQGQVRRDLDYSSMGGSLRINGGIAQVTDRLLASLPGEKTLLDHRVAALRERDDGYRVELNHGGESLQIQTKKVVLAIPPRVIASQIEFEPGLPDAVQQEMSAIPTWMAAHAKLFAIYEQPFWRARGLSGDGISRRGPLMEIHDASPANPGPGALFGFVGLAAGSPLREPSRLKADAVQQLEIMYGPEAAKPVDVLLQDWSQEQYTATQADQLTAQHPHYGMPPGMGALADSGLLFASSEMASQFGGFIEGALEASHNVLQQLP